MERIVIYDTPECRVSIDVYEPYCYFHITINRWSVSVMRDLLARWSKLAPYVRALFHDIYAYYPQGDRKHRKFVSIFGFQFFLNKDGLDIYRWSNV